MESVRVTMNENGRIMIPASFRKKLGLSPHDELILQERDGGLFLISLQARLEEVRRTIEDYNPDNLSLLDLLTELRQEDLSREL